MSRAQDLALAVVAKRSGAVDETALVRALDEKGVLATALVKAGALTPQRMADLLSEITRMRFRCEKCGVEIKYEGLARLDDLMCDRCFARLEPISERARMRSGLPPALKDADRFGKYALGEVLGRGSMGIVYRVKKDGDDTEYALKVMRKGETDLVAIARFAREAEVAARIEHPGIVRVLDQGAEDGAFYYVMELCRGRTLQARITQGPIPPHEAARLVRDMADAVAAAHRSGVVHRDLKPANVILVDPDGRPRITDFGLARDALSEQSLTKTGDTIGTPYYMAPEQVRAERDVDGRADVYSLGVILYECLAGRRPFEAKSPGELGKLILAGARRPLRDHVPSVPAGVEAIALKAFSLARPARYATADELVADLDRFLKGERPHALPPAPARRLRSFALAAWGLGALVFAIGVSVHLARRWGAEERARAEEAVERERLRVAALEAKKAAEEKARRDAEELLVAAEKASREKKRDAYEAWRRLRQASAGNPAIELKTGQFLLRRNHVKEAIDVLKPLVASGALTGVNGLEARSRLAEAYLRARPPSLAAAREELARLVTEDADGARGRLAHARSAWLDGRVDEALRAAEDSLRAEELAPACALLARLLAAGWEPARAVPRYNREAVDRAERSRNDARAHLALRHADRAVALAPDDVDAICARSEVRLNLHVNRWYAHGNLPKEPEYGDFMEARRRDLNDAIELAGSEPDPRALVFRARYRMFFPKEGGARADLEDALARDGSDIEALVYRSVIEEVARGDALPWMRKALEIDERAAFGVARQLHLWKGPAIALAFHASDERIKRSESFNRAHLARVDLRIARARSAARDALRDAVRRLYVGEPTSEVIPAFEKACALAPEDPVPLVELGRALMGRARHADAIVTFDKARGLGAEPVELAALRGEALLRAGLVGEARDELQEVERRASGARKLIAQSSLARAAGDVAAARDAATRAVRTAPDDPEARLALAAALLEGQPSEPDAASAQASWAYAIGGKSDIAAPETQLLASVTGGLVFPRLPEDVLEQLKRVLAAGTRDLDGITPSHRLHARLGAILAKAPTEAARALGKAELEAAKQLAPAGSGR